MENEYLIDNIKSLYILKNIFNYIPDENFNEKLFLFSKNYQKKLSITLTNLKENYLNKIGFNYHKYLYTKNPIYYDIYGKEYLSQKFENFFKKNSINKENIEKIIYDIFDKKNKDEIKEDDEKLINIESPLFNLISKIKNFENIFTIYISEEYIIKYKLEDYYKNRFNEFNDSKIKYKSIFYDLNNIYKFNNIKGYNIDFGRIKKLSLKIDNKYVDEQKGNKFFFESLFSLNKNFENNLIYLKIEFKKENTIKNDLFENINNFKLLEYLVLIGFNFYENFIIKLNTLKNISINNCKNIIIAEDVIKNMENLCLIKMTSIDTLKNIKFRELKKLNLSNNILSEINILEEINLNKLIELNLSNTNISNIDILGKENFSILKILNLSKNQIFDISILEIVKFRELGILDLSNNTIQHIDALQNVNFIKLKELNLCWNRIVYIDVLKKANFKNLRKLNLNHNYIININVLEKVDFKELKELDLGENKITDIKILEKVNFKKLEILYLNSNKISDINILEKVNFKDLRTLDLSRNNISDINILKKLYFKQLKKLNLSDNKITDKSILKNFRMVHNFSNNSFDIVYLIDTTGGMGTCLRYLKDNLHDIYYTLLHEFPKYDFQFGAVAYNDPIDMPSEKNDFFSLTNDMQKLRCALSQIHGGGGGDIPEDWVGAYTLALEKISWRKGRKIIIHITDAPAHGQKWCKYDKYPGEGPKLSAIIKRCIEQNIGIIACPVTEDAELCFSKFQIEYLNENGLFYKILQFWGSDGLCKSFKHKIFDSITQIINNIIIINLNKKS